MTTQTDRTPAPWRRWLPLLAIAAVMALGYGFGLHRHLSLSALVERRTALAAMVDAAPAAALALFVAVYVAAVALSVPGAALLTLAGGFLFGSVAGAAATVVGATVGAVLVFLAARTALAGPLLARAGPFVAKMADGFRRDAFGYLLFLRLVPLFPFWLVNLAPALVGMRLAPFALATAIGILPGTIAFAVLGAGLDDVVAAQIAADPACRLDPACRPAFDLRSLLSPELLAGLVALGLVALLPIVIRVWRGRHAQ